MLSDHRKNLGFTSKCALAASLQGAWQSEDEPDYGLVPLNCVAQLSVSRRKRLGVWRYSVEADGWVNATAINLSEFFARSHIPTLVFTPANKHYPFSNATKTSVDAATLSNLPDLPPFVEVCRILAEYEMGIRSLVFELLRAGTAVHTSLMLEVEKIASELAFRSRSVPIMFATGTLAQGLNLPAIAVIIAGTRIGDPRGQDVAEVERRKLSQLLNAAGRAGRAGFANQGVVVTIPDRPIALRGFDSIMDARDGADFLRHPDNAVMVTSGLDSFLDNICQETLQSDRASDIELQIIALLSGGDTNQLDTESVLNRTFATYRRGQAHLPGVTTNNVRKLIEVRDAFIADTGAPPWLTVAAQRAGLDFFLTLSIYRSWSMVRQAWPSDPHQWGVMEWLNEFLLVVRHIPPGLISRHLPFERLARVSESFRTIQREQPTLLFTTSLDWSAPEFWLSAWDSITASLEAWMHGDPISAISGLLIASPPEDIPHARTSGSPIPKALSIVMESWPSLALIAGGFLAIVEQHFGGHPPFVMSCLPMCIKYGCDSPGTLGWYRFGVRLRRVSRLLATTFPPPPDIASDEVLKDWVRDKRREWLNGETIPSVEEVLQTVLTAAREFVTT